MTTIDEKDIYVEEDINMPFREKSVAEIDKLMEAVDWEQKIYNDPSCIGRLKTGLLTLWKIVFFFRDLLVLCSSVLITSCVSFTTFQDTANINKSLNGSAQAGCIVSIVLFLMLWFIRTFSSKEDKKTKKKISFEWHFCNVCGFMIILVFFIGSVAAFGSLNANCSITGQKCDYEHLIFGNGTIAEKLFVDDP
jgi:hypothetical protein